MDKNLFWEKEITNDYEMIKKYIINIQENTKLIFEKEKLSSFRFNYNDKEIIDKINKLPTLIENLYIAIEIYYSKLHINNKVNNGLLSFESGIDEHSNYAKRILGKSNEFKSTIERLIIVKRLGVVSEADEGDISKMEQSVSRFWARSIFEYLFENYPLCKKFIINYHNFI